MHNTAHEKIPQHQLYAICDKTSNLVCVVGPVLVAYMDTCSLSEMAEQKHTQELDLHDQLKMETDDNTSVRVHARVTPAHAYCTLNTYTACYSLVNAHLHLVPTANGKTASSKETLSAEVTCALHRHPLIPRNETCHCCLPTYLTSSPCVPANSRLNSNLPPELSLPSTNSMTHTSCVA